MSLDQKEAADWFLPNAPLIEVALGVQFRELADLRTAHFGRYWQEIRAEFPKTEDVPPLNPTFDPASRHLGENTGLALTISALPPLRRVWFLSEDETRLIQLQPDRFHFNWRRREGGGVYPKLDMVKDEFFRYFELLEAVGKAEGDSNPPLSLEPLHLELTYINHIVEGDGWSNISDIVNVIPQLAWRSDLPGTDALATPDDLRWNVRLPAPDCSGHLTVSMRTARLRDDERRVLLLELTMRGDPPGNGRSNLSQWIDRARIAIRSAFRTTISQTTMARWEKKEQS